MIYFYNKAIDVSVSVNNHSQNAPERKETDRVEHNGYSGQKGKYGCALQGVDWTKFRKHQLDGFGRREVLDLNGANR